jgi:hypothetical protein
VNELGHQFRKRFENKAALVHAWMREHKKLCVALFVAVKQKVQVNIARASFNLTTATESILNSHKSSEDLLR